MNWHHEDKGLHCYDDGYIAAEAWRRRDGRWMVDTPAETLGPYGRLSDAKRGFARWRRRPVHD